MEKCTFCGIEQTREQAIEAGWEPYFWDYAGDICYDSPVCPECAMKKLTQIDEEPTIREGLEVSEGLKILNGPRTN